MRTTVSLNVYFFFRFVPKAPFIFFKEVTDSVIEQRKNANVKPNDMLQMFLDIKEKGSTKEDSNENNITDQFEKDAELKNLDVKIQDIMTDDAVLQSTILFLIGGFDTTSSALSIMAYHLATKPHIQELVREEVNDTYI